MNPLIALLAGVVGYLLGAVSFARIVARLVAPGQDISTLELAVPGSEARFRSNVVSATTVRLHLGARYGCLTSILDMLKAAAPMLAFRAWHPGAPYYLIAGGMAVVGHNWPIYYQFRGGRGMSPMLGGLFALDWVGVIVTHLLGTVLGAVTRNAIVLIGTGTLLMIPWIWFRSRDLGQVLYAAAMNVVFWTAMAPELREFGRLRREGRLDEFWHAQNVRVMGRRGSEVVEQVTVSEMLRKITRVFRPARQRPD